MTIIIKNKDPFGITALKIELKALGIKNYRPELSDSITLDDSDYERMKKAIKKVTPPRRQEYIINKIYKK